MNKIMISGALSVAAVLAGCSTPGYKCPLVDTSEMGCMSMQDAYGAAVSAEPGFKGENVAFANRQAMTPDGQVASVQRQPASSFSGFPAPVEQGMPVWDPPKVHRGWTAPWTDAEGVLHAGGYVYYTSPGKWNYGTLKGQGQAGGMLEPVKPDQIGFKSVPVTRPVSSSRTEPLNAGNLPVQKAGAVSGITQPYDKLQ